MADTQIASKAAMFAVATLALAAVAVPAHAALVLYTGADDGAGSLATAPNLLGPGRKRQRPTG